MFVRPFVAAFSAMLGVFVALKVAKVLDEDLTHRVIGAGFAKRGRD